MDVPLVSVQNRETEIILMNPWFADHCTGLLFVLSINDVLMKHHKTIASGAWQKKVWPRVSRAKLEQLLNSNAYTNFGVTDGSLGIANK